ncbi:MAG TPA: MFS transporter [Acetobacteraceae bacterium]|nr:MFS transporter [Acetobacteraceae bacterium]
MLQWYAELNAKEKRTMGACFGGWTLDALDVQFYSFVIPTLLATWGISKGEAGVLGTITLLISAFGGWFAGTISDRYGRVRVLQITILWYAVFTFLCALTQNFSQLFICRALQGLGFGGEWVAGAVLMGEVIRDKYRGRAVGLVQTGWAVGWGAAAILYTVLFAIFPAEIAWRVLFALGLLPGLLVFWIRRRVEDAPIFTANAASSQIGVAHLFSALKPPHVATTWRVAMMVTGAQGGSYALSVWMPTYLNTVRHLSSVSTGSYLILHIFGALLGFIIASFLSDAIGRKPTFLISVLASVVMVGIYMLAPLSNAALLWLGFPLGIVLYMMWPPMGPFMTELFPTEVRGNAQGFCYNAGRGIGALFPMLVGFLAATLGLAAAIVIFAFIAYGLMIVALLMLPETHGRRLDSVDQDLVAAGE